MGAMKRFAEEVSVDMGLEGEITDEVLAESQCRLDAEFCDCRCHEPDVQMLHVVACCGGECPHCDRGIKRGYQEHIDHCAMKVVKPGFFASKIAAIISIILMFTFVIIANISLWDVPYLVRLGKLNLVPWYAWALLAAGFCLWTICLISLDRARRGR